MKVLYLIQTHKQPEHIYRLVRTIKQSSPESYVLVSHDFTACHLEVSLFHDLSDVEVVSGIGGRGDFSIVHGYLNAVDWLFSRHIHFDWLVNLSGQDYPIQPLPQIERFLAATQFDGFIEHFNVLANNEQNHWGSREGRDRYLYRYWRSGKYLSRWQRAIIKLPRMVINNIQPWLRLNSSYGLMVGRQAQVTPFNQQFCCYAGSYFKTLSFQCVRYLYDFAQRHPELIEYYQHTCIPDESFMQTVLANSGLFKLCNDHKRYIDWTNTHHGHPKLLTVKDYPALVQSEAHFARKFDSKQDSKVLDLLDARILQDEPVHV